jgi:hypothetical protein
MDEARKPRRRKPQNEQGSGHRFRHYVEHAKALAKLKSDPRVAQQDRWRSEKTVSNA